jgi:peroxiredoxin
MPNENGLIDEGDMAPESEALLCDGEVFEAQTLDELAGERGTVLLFFGFVFSAPALNWWRRYEKHGWHELDGVHTVGVGRDGPYAQNEFLRHLDSPFEVLADVDGEVASDFGVLRGRDGMPDASTARRSVFVLDTDREVRFSWAADDDITPMPVENIEDAVAGL